MANATSITNNGTLTVSTALSGGNGTTFLINGANSTLNIGGTSGINNLTASAAGNTVNFYGSAAQTVNVATYNNLILSGNGVKSLQNNTIVNGILNIVHAGGATASIAAGRTLTAQNLSLDGVGQTTPPFPTTYGGTTSGATHINTTYFAATTGKLNVLGADGRAVPTITFGSAPTPSYLGGPFTVSASTTNSDSSNLTYRVVSGPCYLVSGATFNSTGPGTCVVQAYGAATTNFEAAWATQSISISNANQAPLTVVASPAVVVQGFGSTLSTTGGSGTGTVTYSTNNALACSVIGNILTVNDASQVCQVTAHKAADATYLAANSAALTITTDTYQSEINKSFLPTSILPHGVSTLSITLFNPNPFQLVNASYTDNLIGTQPGLSVGSAGVTGNTCGGNVTAVSGSTTISMSGGTIPAKVGSNNGSCVVQISITSATQGNLINTIPAGAVDANDGSGKHSTNTTPASATLQVSTITAPSVNKTFGNPTMYAGDKSLLTINLVNQDAVNALTGVGITDNLPAGLTISSAIFSPALTNCGSATLTAVPGTSAISISGGGIPAGSGQTCAIKVYITGTIQGSYNNTIPIGAIITDQGVTNAAIATSVQNIQQITLAKAFAPAAIAVGGTSTVTITFNNPSGVDYTNVGLVDTLPVGMFYNSLTSNSCGGSVSYNSGTRQVTISGATLLHSSNPPTVKPCTVVFIVGTSASLATGNLTNAIQAGSLTDDQGVSNYNTVSTNLAVTTALSATKSFFPASISINNPSTATVTLQNATGTDITGVSMTDTLTGGVVLYAAAPTSNTCGGTVNGAVGGTTITLTNGTIPHSATPPAPAGTCAITFQVTATSAVVNYVNTIPTGGICGTEGVVGAVCNTAPANSGNLNISTSLQPVTGWKAFCAGAGPCAQANTNSVSVGGNSALTVSLTAPADTSLSNFSVTDTLPTGMTIFNPPPSRARVVWAARSTSRPGPAASPGAAARLRPARSACSRCM